jgi:Tfp pilus assembly protein PilN
VKAVNLIPTDARRGGASASIGKLGPGYMVLALLAIALTLVTLYVLTGNSISQRQAQLAGLRQQVADEQAREPDMSTYVNFENLAQKREATVRQIAATRFDWHGALSDLARVMPAHTALQSLVATASSSTSAVGDGASGDGIRTDLAGPAFELTGCTASQDDVAQLISRLRLIDGVQRVTLGSSVKPDSGASSSAGGSDTGCGANWPNFDIVVFFQTPAGATTTAATQ